MPGTHLKGTAGPAGPDAGPTKVVVDTGRSPFARFHPVPLDAVRLEDSFWAPRLRVLREVTLRQQYEQCESTGRIDNFRRAAGKKQGNFRGRYYNDSDVYKWLEAAAFALASEPDPALASTVSTLVGEIGAAQSANGYLNTYFTFERAAERWTDLTNKHEMYCAGHLIQAAVAHHRATGSDALLRTAVRLAGHILQTFNPQARAGTDGHEEIELAMVELYRATGDRRHLDEASFLLDQRGQQPPVLSGSAYHQDHLPVRQQREVVGHAVRATYLACGMADVALETGEPALLIALEQLWQSAFGRKAYITGGLGAHWSGEAFGADYELPNERAYAETCAAIGGFMWNWRMLALTGDARFADWAETALYNGILSGLSLDGQSYFYQNPLADRGGHRRQPWFGTACCPPNIARLLLALPGYMATTAADELWLHLYAAGNVRAAVGGGTLALRLATDYPWDGEIQVEVLEAPGAEVALTLRVPGWCPRAQLLVNGVPLDGGLGAPVPGSYVAARRRWKRGDTLTLSLAMPVHRQRAHPHVLACTGRVALSRGPLVYCVEAADHPEQDVWDMELPVDARLTPVHEPGLLGGVTVVRGTALATAADQWAGALYRPVDIALAETAPGSLPITAPGGPTRTLEISAIPYYAWANREPGPMQVWLRAGA